MTQTYYEYVGNMHMHTPYSDGERYHVDIAQAAITAGLDFVIVTDHNVWVNGLEGYYIRNPARKVLLLTGEEIHDTRRRSQGNHMLIYGAEQELAHHAANPQELIDEARKRDGICYLAHPIDLEAPAFNEPGLPWQTWEIDGYTGIELWNYMSEFKTYIPTMLQAAQAALNPEKYISGPYPETLALWDKLLAEGRQVKIIGGADAHGTSYSLGPVTRTIFPYEYLFRCVNTHILTPRPFNGDLEHDKRLVLHALRDGHAFVGYDLPASTKSFRFSAQGHNERIIMGGRIRMGHGITLQAVIPAIGDTRILRNGEIVLHEIDGTHYTYIANEPGVYRVEVYLNFKGKKRGWIFSNPIWVL